MLLHISRKTLISIRSYCHFAPDTTVVKKKTFGTKKLLSHQEKGTWLIRFDFFTAKERLGEAYRKKRQSLRSRELFYKILPGFKCFNMLGYSFGVTPYFPLLAPPILTFENSLGNNFPVLLPCPRNFFYSSQYHSLMNLKTCNVLWFGFYSLNALFRQSISGTRDQFGEKRN